MEIKFIFSLRLPHTLQYLQVTINNNKKKTNILNDLQFFK